MTVGQLEKQLKRRKWIYFGVAAAFIAVAVSLMCVFGFVLDNFIGVVVCISVCVLCFLAIFFILRIKVKSIDVKGQRITVYKFFATTLYIDGEQQGTAHMFSANSAVAEGTLKDGTTLQVIVSAMFVQLVFSDGTPPMII